MIETLDSGAPLEILTDDAFNDAYVAVKICDLGELARSAVFMRGLVESNFFKTELGGFTFAVVPGTDRLVIQDRFPKTDLDDAAYRHDYLIKAGAMYLRAFDIVDMLKRKASAAQPEEV